MAVGGEAPRAMRLQSIPEMDAVRIVTEHKDFSLHRNCQELAKLLQSVNNSIDNPLIQQILLASKDIEELRPSERPTSEFYDAVIVFARPDKKMATEIMNFMNGIVLEKNEHPKVCLFDKAEFGGSEIKLPKTLIDRCSLIFPLLTDNFEHDEDVQFLNEETVAGTRLGDVKQWQKYCVRPLHSKPKKERKYPTPFGLASIRSYDVFDFNDEHTISKFKDLFEYSLSNRKNREKESKRARHGKPNMDTDQAQTNLQCNDDGQTLDLHNLDGRQSLPDEKATQTFSGDDTPVQEMCRSPTSSLIPTAAACKNGFEGAIDPINTLLGHNAQRVTEEPTSISGTQHLSELSLCNDYVTITKPNAADVTRKNDISVDLKQRHGNGLHKSDILKEIEDKVDQQITSVQTPGSKPVSQPELKKYSANDDPNIVKPTHNTAHMKSDSPQKEQEQEQERHSSMEAEFGSKSVAEETTEMITQGMLHAAPSLTDNIDDDVEEEDQLCTEVHRALLGSHELTGNDTNGNSEVDTKSVNGEVNHVSADTTSELTEGDPDQTQIQSLTSKGKCAFDSMQKEMSLSQDSSLDDKESIIKEVSPNEQISATSQNDDGVMKSSKVAQYTDIGQNNTVIKLPLGSDYPEKIYETVTELVMRGSGPAHSKHPGLCSSPESEYMQFANAFPPRDGTLPKNSMTDDHRNEEKEKSKSVHSSDGVAGHKRPSDGNPDKLDGTQLPVESAAKTIVYIYNSSDIRIQGENNIHMKDYKSESQGEQKTNAKKKEMKKYMNPDWLPPHRQKEQKCSLSLMNSQAPKLITQGGDVCSGNTSQASSFTEQSQSSASGDSRESSFDVIQSSKPMCDKHETDDGCVAVKKAQDAESLKTVIVSDSKTLDPILTNGSNPEIETLQDSEKDGEVKRKKKQAKVGCFPFLRLKRKKKEKAFQNEQKGTQHA